MKINMAPALVPILHAMVPRREDRPARDAGYRCPCGAQVGWWPDNTCYPDECEEPDGDGITYRWMDHVIITGITPPDLRVCIDCALDSLGPSATFDGSVSC